MLLNDVVNQPSGSASFANANVGTDKTVTFSYSISGADAADYALIQPHQQHRQHHPRHTGNHRQQPDPDLRLRRQL